MSYQREVLEATNIDSTQFDGNKYLASFLKTNNINDMYQKCNELQLDVKNYDHDIQSLVFENYNKFIISIQTVKKMKLSIENVEDKLQKLQSSMNRINQLGTKINDSLSVKHNEIQKLDIINQDLQKLKNLCDFPIILKNDIKNFRVLAAEHNNFAHLGGGGAGAQKSAVHAKIDFSTVMSQSVESYQQCYDTFMRFKHEKLIKPIYEDSIHSIEEMRSILWGLQNLGKLDSMSLQQITKKLAVVVEDQEPVLKNYLKIVKDRIFKYTKEQLDAIFNVKNQQKLQSRTSQEEELTLKYLQENEFRVGLDEFEQKKIQISDQLNEIELHQEGTCLWMINMICEKVFPEISIETEFLLGDLIPSLKDNKNKSLSNVELLIKEAIIQLLQNLSEKLTFLRLSNLEVNQSIKKINQELQRILGSQYLQRQFKTEIQDKFSEHSEQIFRGQLFNSFYTLRHKLIQLVIQLRENCANFKQKIEEETLKKQASLILTDFKNQLYCIVAASLIELRPFFVNSASNISFIHKSDITFLSLIHGQFVDFMRLILKLLVLQGNAISVEHITSINAFVSSKTATTSNNELMNIVCHLKQIDQQPLYYIVVHEFFVQFEKTLVFSYVDILYELYHKKIPDQNKRFEYQQLKASMESQELPKIISQIKTDVNKNLAQYSVCYSKIILEYLKKSYFAQKNFKNGAKPQGVSGPIAGEVLKYFKQIQVELSVLFPDAKRGYIKKQSILSNQALDVDMEKMLAKKSHHFEKNEIPNRSHVLLSVFKSTFKGLIEYIRRLKFDRHGFQQIQLDMFLLAQISYEMVAIDDESIIFGFYHEILSSAMAGTLDDPQTLDPLTVDQLTGPIRNELKF